MDYDYREAMREDVAQAIAEKCEWTGKTVTQMYETVEEAYDQLYDDMWIDDSVTGNASGSYTFNAYKAEEFIAHNWDLLREALEEFGSNLKDAYENGGVEGLDVTIRCYLLGEILTEVLENIFEEK